ncbi:MAG TPA: hypothetical protein VNW94_20455 [Streptosporangiaceae bacterium]|nr:hypothetical protein [Streptosporangiaceae bacterium]
MPPPTGWAELGPITCGGRFDLARHSYADNLVVSGVVPAGYHLSDLIFTSS